jgi:hypothetical protein
VSLSQQIRNAYDARNRDELERCLRAVDEAARPAGFTVQMHQCRRGPSWYCALAPGQQVNCQTCAPADRYVPPL